jgi:integrase
MKITAKVVAALKLPRGKTDAIYFCDDLPGFGIRLRTSGDRVRRTWVAQYRAHGRTRRVLIASAETVGAEQARAAAKKVLAKAALGEDPQAAKIAERQKQQRREHTLRAVVDDYLAAKLKEVRSRTYRELVRYLTGHFFEPLHATPIDQITRRDVAVRLSKIIAENGSISAGRARGALSAFYAWAMGMGLTEQNPTIGTIKPQDSKPRERVLADSELAAIWRASGDDAYGKVLKLLILTAARRGEVGGMQWSELDLERGIWSLPPERTKNARAHTLPLSPVAIQIIQSIPRRADRDHLFGTHSTGGLAHWHAKHELDQRVGTAVAPWRLHDVRRTVATRMCDLGVAPHVVEELLNHHSGHRSGIAGIYNRSRYEREVKAAVALWADHIRTLIEGGERKVLGFPQATA